MNIETLIQIDSIKINKKAVIKYETILEKWLNIYNSVRSLEKNPVVKDYSADENHFTYYCNKSLYTFSKIFSYYKSIGKTSISIFDFGSGAGILMKIVKELGTHFGIDITIYGCDKYSYYVTLANRINYPNSNFIKLDMTKITKKSFNFNKIDLFYFWTPLRNPIMIDQFITRFSKIVNNEQLIYYIPANKYFSDRMETIFEHRGVLFCKRNVSVYKHKL